MAAHQGNEVRVAVLLPLGETAPLPTFTSGPNPQRLSLPQGLYGSAAGGLSNTGCDLLLHRRVSMFIESGELLARTPATICSIPMRLISAVKAFEGPNPRFLFRIGGPRRTPARKEGVDAQRPQHHTHNDPTEDRC